MPPPQWGASRYLASLGLIFLRLKPQHQVFPISNMSGIPIKTGGWRDKARWGQPCFFSSPRPDEAIDSPSQARPEDGSNTINSQSDAGDTPVRTPQTPPDVPETLTVSPATPVQDLSRPLSQQEIPYLGVHPASKTRCKYRSAPYQRAGAPPVGFAFIDGGPPPVSYPPPHKGGLAQPVPNPTPHTDNLRGPGLPIPPPRPTPRSFRPCTAYEPLRQTRAVTQAFQFAIRDPPKTRIAHWPRPRLPLAVADPITKRGLDDDQRSSCLERWGLLELSLRRFSTTTLTTYMRCLVSFLDFLAAGGHAFADLTLAELTDYLFAVQYGQEEDRSSNQTCPRTMLKALSWLQKVAQLEPLRPLLHNPVVMAFHSDSKPTDRREAMPLPLAVIAAWETHVCNPSCSESLRLFLGGLLLATHSSLRFGDLQRIIPESLSLAQDSLRGSCWTTKTSTQGQPFAITVYGITGRNVESAWPIHWLQAVASCLSRSIQTYGENHVPDFILPAFSPAQLLVDPLYSAPLQYSHALASIRWAAQTAWLPSPCLTLNEASNLTLHSLKVTFLRRPPTSPSRRGAIHMAWTSAIAPKPCRTACGLSLDNASILGQVDISLAHCKRPACVFARGRDDGPQD